MIEKVNEVRKLLEDAGFTQVGLKEGVSHTFTYTDDKHCIMVTIDIDKNELTAKDEEIIKERLKQLGYIID